MLLVRTIGASAIALIAGAGMAIAADIPRYEAPPMAPAYTPTSAFSWTGPYVGLTGGYAWGSGGITHEGWLGGAYAGYNFQTGTNWVVGLEGDFTFTNKSGSAGALTVENPWNSTIRGRVGYAYDRFLFYGTGGVAFGKVKVNHTDTTSDSSTRVGWTAGAGIEAALTDTVTARLEYRHTDLGSHSYAVTGVPTVSTRSDDLMVGVGFKF